MFYLPMVYVLFQKHS